MTSTKFHPAPPSKLRSQSNETPVKPEYPTPESPETEQRYGYRIQQAINAIRDILDSHPHVRQDKILARLLGRHIANADTDGRRTPNVDNLLHHHRHRGMVTPT